jgi:hypothetical protein
MTAIGMSDGRPQEPRRLRELAAWYREFAERTGNPVIWEARLRTAAELEHRMLGRRARGIFALRDFRCNSAGRRR